MNSILKMMSDLDRKTSAISGAMTISKMALNPVAGMIPKHIMDLAFTSSHQYKSTMDYISGVSSITKQPAWIDIIETNNRLFTGISGVTRALQVSNTQSDFYKTFNWLAKVNAMQPLGVNVPASLFQTITNLDNSFTKLHELAHIGSEFKGISNLILNSLPLDLEYSNFDGENELSDWEKKIQKLADWTNEMVENVPVTVDRANELLKMFTSYFAKEFEDFKFMREVILPLMLSILPTLFTSVLNTPAPTNNFTTNNYYIDNSTDNTKIAPISNGELVTNSIVKDVRRFPRKDSKAIATIPIGSEITILKFTRKWAKVFYRTTDNNEGYGWITKEGLE
jgi:hypothetical protein